MNYGYNKKTKGWEKINPDELAIKLSKKLNIPIGNNSNDGVSPYIEIDGAYGGVRIRRITHLSEDEYNNIIAEADAVYNELAGLSNTLRLKRSY